MRALLYWFRAKASPPADFSPRRRAAAAAYLRRFAEQRFSERGVSADGTQHVARPLTFPRVAGQPRRLTRGGSPNSAFPSGGSPPTARSTSRAR